MKSNKQASLDFSSFSRPVSFSEMRAYARGIGKGAIAGVVIILVVMGLLGLVVYLIAGPAAASSVGFWITGSILALFAALVFGSFVQESRKGVRLQRFALANGFTYIIRQPVTQEMGVIFELGSDRHTDRVVKGDYGGHPFWFGKHFYTVGSGKNSRTISVGVLAVTLPRAVPHVIIDGRQNTMRSAQGIDRSQRLELEGDFGNYFTVYCPKDYERDVLYFLTPELMQQLIDMDDKFDMELVGSQMYFYTAKEIPPNEVAIKNLFTLLAKLSSEVVENTARYQDWRIDRQVASVAPAGLRLKKSIWPGIIMVIFIIIYFLSIVI